MPRTLRDGLVALSLSNLCFMSAWQVLLNPLHYTYYNWKYHPGFSEYAALAIDILLLAMLFWGTMTLGRRSGRQTIIWLARWAFLLILIIPINNLRLQFFNPGVPSRTNFLGGVLILGAFSLIVLSAIVLRRLRMSIIRTAVIVVLILFPVTLITFTQGAWLTLKYRSYATLVKDKTPAPPLNSNKKGAPRVLWIVFDELDQNRAFLGRSAGVALPALDRLRTEAIFSSNAYPPSRATMISFPALIIGKPVFKVLLIRPDELILTLKESNEEVPWSTQPNIFSAARARGFDTALVGWSNPYCRIIGDSLTSCTWERMYDEISPIAERPTILTSMSEWASRLLLRTPGMYRVLNPIYETKKGKYHIEEYLRILDAAKSVVRNREFGLTFLHFPIPHSPFIYDRHQNALSSRPDRSYEDNLVLTDRTLSEVRREMEDAGLWEGTTVIVTSDHWWRTPPDRKIDYRVPFMVKLAGQKVGVTYDARFNTVLTSKLVLALLNGEITSPDSATRWIDVNRSTAGPADVKN